VLPSAHRFGRRALRRGVILLSIVTALLMAIFARRLPFDAMHQKRLFILHTENVRHFTSMVAAKDNQQSYIPRLRPMSNTYISQLQMELLGSNILFRISLKNLAVQEWTLTPRHWPPWSWTVVTLIGTRCTLSLPYALLSPSFTHSLPLLPVFDPLQDSPRG
jgi:hypothetical protein